MFGLNFAFFRRKEFQTFRKTLNPDFKMNRKSIHKNPHAIPLQTKNTLLQQKKSGNWQRIRDLQRKSNRPFGKFIRTKFIFDRSRVPFYDIPDLSDFQLKPYVSFLTPKILKQKIPRPDGQQNKQKQA